MVRLRLLRLALKSKESSSLMMILSINSSRSKLQAPSRVLGMLMILIYLSLLLTDHLPKMLIFLRFPISVLGWSSGKKEKRSRISPINQERSRFK